MNVLDAVITEVGEPVWLESYRTWSVPIVYNCWGSEGKTEKWCKSKGEADSIKVGDVIYV